MAFVFGLQTLQLKDFSKIYQLKSLKPKNKGHTNFYECCDLTEKVYLTLVYRKPSSFCILDAIPRPHSLFSILGAPVFVLWGINVDPVWVNALFFRRYGRATRSYLPHVNLTYSKMFLCQNGYTLLYHLSRIYVT